MKHEICTYFINGWKSEESAGRKEERSLVLKLEKEGKCAKSWRTSRTSLFLGSLLLMSFLVVGFQILLVAVVVVVFVLPTSLVAFFCAFLRSRGRRIDFVVTL